MRNQQLPLALKLDIEATFDNFYVADSHRLVVDQLRQQSAGLGDKWVYVGGAAGRSHLLQACCHFAEASGLSARYIPLAELVDYDPEALLEACEYLDLLCLDDIDAVLGRDDWERALFNCYNRMLMTKSRMLVASRLSLGQLEFGLPDLRSRLQSFSAYVLRDPGEPERLAALQFRATLRGVDISDSIAEYIYMRCQRDLHSLFGILNKLDQVSLVEQRKLTIPFVKKVMSW
jgi:DnaA family protein